MKNEKLLPASAFVVVTTGVLASVEKNSSLPNVSFWIGIAIAYLFMSLIATFNSDFGNGLAILVMVAALLGNGEDIAKFVDTKTKGKIGNKPVADERDRSQINVPGISRRLA